VDFADRSSGTICRIAILRIKPVIVAFSNGNGGGRFKVILQILAADLGQRGGSEASTDASFSGPKKGLWSW